MYGVPLPAPKSLSRTVPSALPSLFQSLASETPSVVVKKRVPSTFVRFAGFEVAAPGARSWTSADDVAAGSTGSTVIRARSSRDSMVKRVGRTRFDGARRAECEDCHNWFSRRRHPLNDMVRLLPYRKSEGLSFT